MPQSRVSGAEEAVLSWGCQPCEDFQISRQLQYLYGLRDSTTVGGTLKRRCHMIKHVLSAMFVAMGLAGGIASAETIQGIPQSAGLPGLVEITIQGDPIPHTGILISPNLALADKRWFGGAGANPRNVTVAHGHGSNRQPVTKVATDIWPHQLDWAALVRVSSGFSNVPAVHYEAPAPAVGTDLVCYGFSQGRDLKRAELRVLSRGERVMGSGVDEYIAVSRARTDMILADGKGIPCFAAQNGQPTNTLTGLAYSTTGTNSTDWKHRQSSAWRLKDWIPNMVHLSKVRATGARPMNLYTRPNPNNLNIRMCLHISTNVLIDREVAQVPCNDSTDQLFYFHNFQDSRNPSATHYTIVHHSGRCLEIPNSSKISGVKTEAARCDEGLNQDWEQSIYQPRPPEGIKLKQIFSNLCLSAPAPPNSATSSLRIEQNTCLNSTTNYHQRWFIRWR